MTEAARRPWPTELRLNRAKDTLTIAFDNGESFTLPAEYLRVSSRSAEVKGHGAQPHATVAGKRNVKISAIDAIGNYAVRITFDDGHDTGLYTWEHLYELGSEEATKWPAYLEELAAQGLSRG
ncbi:MAG: gamma-butyrobetaine hydroxylase-like domain-containing protein [Alphaproteobacteria bacterium]